MRILLPVVALAGCVAGETAFPSSVVDAPAPVAKTHANPANVDFMVRGYFYAYAKSTGLGGNATSDNVPQPMANIRSVLTAKDGLHVLALVDEPRTFEKKYDGFRVIVANASNHSETFEAQDSRLYMIHEAIDPSGNWAPIEYLPNSWCGNSYHTLELPARTYWEFTAPHYDGDFATRLRLQLQFGDGAPPRVTYSDEFPGRINKQQFTDKQGHSPQNIMDPYND